MKCPSCNTENPAGVKFCAECGAPIAAVPRPLAERRQVTVFFVDIVGSTALAERLDPEELRDLYARYQAVSAEVIQRYEGHIAQYLGDGILAYFGYPAAHEDDAARAVRSGLEIVQRLERIGAGGSRPQVRIGIHTGLVVVGDVGGGGRQEQLALGEAPNIAARIQSEAAPDTVLISDATRQLTGGQFLLEGAGAPLLKGISRPMQLFRVVGRSGSASRFHAMTAASGLTALVGREREADLLRAAWLEAAAGQGQTRLLRGEPGIGKSRLLMAARKAAEDRPHEVLDAECSPYQGNSPLYPVIELLERQMGLSPDMTNSERLDHIERFAAIRGATRDGGAAAAIAEVLSIPAGDRFGGFDMPPAKKRQWAMGVVADLLMRPASGLPVLLVVEDLHWADPSTLDLIGGIVARQRDAAVLLVCTARPEFTVPWQEQPQYREMTVTALPPVDARALVAGVAGPKPLPVSLLNDLVARTGGIPLFVETVTRAVMESGLLRELDDRFELTGPLPPSLIPTTVQASLMGRIDKLGADRSVAQLAATIGREFSFELLQGVLGQPTATLAKTLARLAELDLVSQDGVPPDATYLFKHALIQDAAYESLLRKTRQEFHGRIAEALTGRFSAMAEGKPELLARHYEGAGKIAEAIDSWLKAGTQALQRWALRESVAYLRKAIVLLETLPEDDPRRLQAEMEAQLALSPALMSTLGWGSPEVEATCIRARDLCERAGNAQGLLAARWGLWTVYLLRGTIDLALDAAKPVLAMAEAAGDPMLRLIARQAIGYSTYFLADFAGARGHAEQALALYDPDQERALATIFQLPASFACGNFLSMSLWFTGYPDQAEQHRRQAWGFIEALAFPACTAYGLGNAMMLLYARRDRDAVEEAAAKLFIISDEGGYLLWAAQGRIYRGWARAMKGGAAEAEAGLAEMHAGLESYRLTGSGIMLPQMCLMLAEALLQAGRPGEALAAIDRGLRLAVEHHEHVHEPDLHRLMGEIQIAQGLAADGEASLRRAIAVARAQNARILELRAAVAVARLRGSDAETLAQLRTICQWFQEGLDMPELVAARALLS